jgi:hypothetical protein
VKGVLSMRRRTTCATYAVGIAVCLLAASGALATGGEKIRIHQGDRAVTATLNDSAAARDFVAMLPLTLHMHDWLSREKVAAVPGPISEASEGTPNYNVGDLGYWRPSNHFVIYYANDGTKLPPPGIVLLGKIDGAAAIFDAPGDLDVTVECAN